MKVFFLSALLMLGVSASEASELVGKSKLMLAPAENATFLSDTRYNSDLKMDQREFNATWVDSAATKEASRSYTDLSKRYEFRERVGVMSRQSTDARDQELKDLSKDYITAIRTAKARQITDETAHNVENSKEYDAVKEPAAVVVAMGALYFGKSIQWKLSNDVSLKGYGKVNDRVASLTFRNPIFNASMEFDGRVNQFDEDHNDKNRYKYSIQRPLFFGVQSEVRYGSTDGLMTTSLSKEIANNLTAECGASRQMQTADLRDAEQKVKLRYDLRF